MSNHSSTRNPPSCRHMRTIDGVTHCFFVRDGKMTSLPMGQFLARSGLKVRV